MSADRPNLERRSASGPTTAREAFEELFRGFACQSTQAEVVDFIKGIDPVKIVEASQGIMTTSPLTPFEAVLATTLNDCAERGLLRTALQAVGLLTSLKVDMQTGRTFFVGQERKPQ